MTFPKLSSTDSATAAYSPKSGIDYDMFLSDGLTHAEKSEAITKLSHSDRCESSESEISVTLESRRKVDDFLVSSCELKIGYVSQAGFYPTSLHRLNEDAFLVLHPDRDSLPKLDFQNGFSKSFCVLGVFDGHGQTGHQCSQFASVNFRTMLVRKIDEIVVKRSELSFEFTFESFAMCLKQTLLELNVEMHRHFDTSRSGTTAIVSVFFSDKIITANVGDSRACVFESIGNGDGIGKVFGMSSDQTPFRRDERLRVRQKGAVIQNMQQREQGIVAEEVQMGYEMDFSAEDPPRLWSPNPASPGVAFTRSLGDLMAEGAGCIALAEISETKLNADSLVCLGSDGVFEFLSNEQVFELLMVGTSIKVQDLNMATCAKALVEESYKLWLQYEVRTDDITAICVRVKSAMSAPSSPIAAAVDATAPLIAVDPLAVRPVRRNLSVEKQQKMNTLTPSTMVDIIPLSSLPVWPKTDFETECLLSVLKSNFMFANNLSSERQMREIIPHFEKLHVKPGQIVIQQGDEENVNHFYVVFSGTFNVLVDGQKVYQYNSTGYPVEGQQRTPPSFGELALMFSSARQATVQCDENVNAPCILFSLSKQVFQSSLSLFREQRDQYSFCVNILSNISIFQSLSRSQLLRLADALSLVKFHDQETIISQGDFGDCLYLIKQGKVNCFVDRKQVMQISENDSLGYFGERALLFEETRAASVVADGDVALFCLSRKSFETLLGPLKELIKSHSKLREMEALAEKVLEERRSQKQKFLEESVFADGVQRLVKVEKDMKIMYQVQTPIESLNEELKRELQILKMLCFDENLEKRQSFCLQLTDYSLTSTTFTKRFQNALLPMTLNDFIATQPKIEESVLCYIANNLINGLHFLCQRNIICRSLCPTLIRLSTSGTLILADFTLAKKLEDRFDRAYTLACRDSLFLTPSQVINQGASKYVDFFALGLLLWELLFNGKSVYLNDVEDPNSLVQEDLFRKIADFHPERVLSSEDTITSVSEELLALFAKLWSLDSDVTEEEAEFIIGTDKELNSLLKECWFKKHGIDNQQVEGLSNSPFILFCDQHTKDLYSKFEPINNSNNSSTENDAEQQMSQTLSNIETENILRPKES